MCSLERSFIIIRRCRLVRGGCRVRRDLRRVWVWGQGQDRLRACRIMEWEDIKSADERVLYLRLLDLFLAPSSNRSRQTSDIVQRRAVHPRTLILDRRARSRVLLLMMGGGRVRSRSRRGRVWLNRRGRERPSPRGKVRSSPKGDRAPSSPVLYPQALRGACFRSTRPIRPRQ